MRCDNLSCSDFLELDEEKAMGGSNLSGALVRELASRPPRDVESVIMVMTIGE